MAVTSYSYNSKVQLSTHFNVSEVRCKCGKTHATKFDPSLCTKLEKLYKAFDCSKIVVVSGYRCTAHDKAVGGNGYGRHTVGDAVDVTLYDKAGKKISTKLISCVAVELGFGGVANINKTHTNIHLDNRTTKYYGDEIYGYSSIWNQIGIGGKKWDNFYDYYGINKSDITPYLVRAGVATTQSTAKKTSTGQSGDNPDITKWTYKSATTIKELQTILKNLGEKITVDGIAGINTYNAVIKYPVSRGTKNNVVKWVQTRLLAMGYAPGTADGIAGTKTMDAINRMKSDYGVTTSDLTGKAFYYLLV